MSKKRKILLFTTIGIIVVCYGFAFYLITINYSDTPQQNFTLKEEENKYPVYQTSTPPKVESQYKGNQLPNGTSPLNDCFGKGIYSGKATLTIKNGGGSDAIVCLYSITHDRTIRNEYVQKNTSFTMSNIQQGGYKIRVFYGNDWNPELENPCGFKGYFEIGAYFSEFNKTEYFLDNHDGYTVATITLYAVVGGNAPTSHISQADFFKK